MKKEELRDRFHMADTLISIDEEKKQETLLFLRQNIAEKRMVMVNNRKQILKNQIRYMDKTIIGIHAFLCILLLMTVAVMSNYNMPEERIIPVSMILSGILGVVSIMEISRIFYSGIAELSESCYFNVKQLVAFHMAMSGAVNLAVLSIGILFVGYQWQIDLLQIGLYVLVPFVMSECCCLRALLSRAGRKNSCLALMTAIFMIAAFYLVWLSMPQLYRAAALGIWGIAFVIGILLLSIQMKILIRGIEKGEIICTN